MSQVTYIFNEFDKRALIGVLVLETIHKNLKFKPVTTSNCFVETLVIKDKGQDTKLSGFFTIINHLNPKLANTTKDVDFAWKIAYGLTYLKTVIKKKKASTKLKINKSVLDEIEELLQKQPYIGGKNMGELDIVAYVNIGETVEKKAEKYAKEYPGVSKMLTAVKQAVAKLTEEYQIKFPKAKKEEPKGGEKKEEAKKEEKKEQAKKEQAKKEAPKEEKRVEKKGGEKKAAGKEEEKKEEKPKPSKKKAEIDPEVLEILKKCKINRLTKGKVILPRKDKKNILITSALPYVNNVPHLGNIIGCVLSADVYARWCRLRGYNTLFIGGTDEYGTATETKALQEGKTPREICDHYFKIHDQIYNWFDCDFDYHGRTSTPAQTKICQDIFKKLYDRGELVEDTMTQLHCGKCNRFLADRFVLGICPHCQYEDARGDQCDKCGKLLDPTELKEPKCNICKSTPEMKSTKHMFLDLPKILPDLEKFIDKNSVEGGWSANSITVTRGWIKQGLRPRCITRDLKWGVPVPLKGYEDKVFYVWYDAPIGYISITANYTEEWEQWWKNPENVKLVQFMGKDNIPFHTVMFPSTLIGTGENWTLLNTISTTEYLNYEHGLKFSKSRGTGVFGDGAQQTKIPSEVWRYQLLINRPESADTEFNWDDFSTKINNELIANIGNLCNRILKFIYEKLDKKVPVFKEENLLDRDHAVLKEVYEKFKEYNDHFDKVEIKAALKTAMEASAICNKYMQEEKPWEKENIASKRSDVVLGVLANLIRFLSAIFEPFMPSFSAKINYILGRQERTEEDEILIETLVLGDPLTILRLLPSGQTLNKPVPLFEPLTQEEINDYRERYSKEKSQA